MGEEAGSERGVPLLKTTRYQTLDRLAEQLLPAVPKQPLDLAIHEDDPSCSIDHDHPVRRRLDGGAESGFGALARADVDHGGKHQDAFNRLDRVQPDLHRDLDAVLPEPVEVAARSHGARLRVREKVRTQARVPATDVPWHEQLDGLAEELCPA